jgi:D-lactate dehydrogenase
MSKISFLEVFSEDKLLIQERFPEASVFEDVLDGNLLEEIRETEVLCVFVHSKITKEVIEKLKNLKLIVTRSVGYDHIDLKAADERGIVVVNVPDYGAHVISEFVFALLLSGLRYIDKGDKRVEEVKDFSPIGLRGVALKGKTIGIVGTGKIGKHVARIASLGFLMNVLAYDAYPQKEMAEENHFSYVDLNTLWERADIITLHCPLLSETRHMINKESIAKMKDGVIIVNTSRGGIIETEALVAGIKSGKVAHAFLDVLEHENNIAKDEELIALPNVITTPHIAFYADDSMQRMYESAFLAIENYLKEEDVENKVIGF